MSTQRLMKDGLGDQAVARMAQVLARVVAHFPERDFRREALRGLAGLELRQRVQHIIAALSHICRRIFHGPRKY